MEYILKFKAAAAWDLYKLTKKDRDLGNLIVNEHLPALMRTPLKGHPKNGDLKRIRSWDFTFRNISYRILYEGRQFGFCFNHFTEIRTHKER